MNDEIGKHNREKWEELAKHGVQYSKPYLDLDETSARQIINSHDLVGDVRDKTVLCLAGGGGQQSAAFALLGAVVSVIDISQTQIERDRQALEHYGFQARLEQGDMRDLSMFDDHSFDIVWHAWSINFVPDVSPVFDEVRRVLRPNGLYYLAWGNPFVKGMEENDWTEKGYPIKRIYADGELTFDTDYWEFTDTNGEIQRVVNPREFNHTLSTVINGLIQRDFELLGLWEDEKGDASAQPGSWEHLTAVAPRDLTLWARYKGR